METDDELKERLSKMIKECPRCGKFLRLKNLDCRFCHNCGFEISPALRLEVMLLMTEQELNRREMLYSPDCDDDYHQQIVMDGLMEIELFGAGLSEPDKFCEECGIKLPESLLPKWKKRMKKELEKERRRLEKE